MPGCGPALTDGSGAGSRHCVTVSRGGAGRSVGLLPGPHQQQQRRHAPHRLTGVQQLRDDQSHSRAGGAGRAGDQSVRQVAPLRQAQPLRTVSGHNTSRMISECYSKFTKIAWV